MHSDSWVLLILLLLAGGCRNAVSSWTKHGENKKGVCVWERDWELWSDSGQCVKKRDGAIGHLFFSWNLLKINIDHPIWCNLGLRCLAQEHNGHGVHESLWCCLNLQPSGFPSQIFNHYPQMMEDIRRLLVQGSSRSHQPLFPWARHITPGSFG